MAIFQKHGFTLVELLVVVAIIALLAMLLIPTFNGAKDHANATICKKNLGEMSGGLASTDDRPYPGQWRRFLRDRGMSGVLTCPSDADIDLEINDEDFPELEDVFLVQKQGGKVRFSNVKLILETGVSAEDNQIKRKDNAHGITALPGQMLIAVGSECALVRVTYGNVIKFESMIVPTKGTGHNSVHWLCLDDGGPDWRYRIEAGFDTASPDDIFIMRLQSGHRYTQKAPDYEVGFNRSSYAMSDAVHNTDPRPGQLLLVEYTKDIARVLKGGYRTDEFGNSNADPRGFLRTRHFNMANFATTTGSVRSMTREQLQWEYDHYANGIWAP
ncbi:MAG: type II secretion system protein [Phycisphaerae bacterium]|jgi:prepilin-type N-terminal cleavage/methylation domain-containing protein|nr:type II secretion system protein [Phycisphaerae bacterium]